MKVIIDERETALYNKCVELNTFATVQIVKQVLPIGDILFKTDDDLKTLCIIERKSLADLLASIKDGRYEEQSYRLSNNGECSLHNVIYIIEGIMSTLRTPMEKRLVFSSITSLNYFKGFSVLRSSSVTETAELLLFAADKIARGLAEGNQPATGSITNATVGGEQNYCTVVKKVKKENVTPQNIAEIILCQIPGISSTNAIAIMKKFTSISDLIDKIRVDPNCLDDIRIENNGKSRKIGKNCVDGIRNYLLPAALE
jgi:ERCC4-type nuclease